MASPANSLDLTLGGDDLRYIAMILHQRTGIVIREHKQAMARGRLARRVKALGLASIGEYCAHLKSPRGKDELPELINALTTNHTAFFRERHHFDYMLSDLLPEFHSRSGEGRGRLRIWCTASSTGEEPYSIAAVLASDPGIRAADARILATDIDSEVIGRATTGIYARDVIDRSPPDLKRLLKLEPGPTPHEMTIAQPLRQFLTFGTLNLIEPWPMRGPLDIIFCRNVFIYFDIETKAALIDRYVQLLRPGGWLFLGHSESLPKSHPALRLIGRTIYRRQ